MVARLGHDRESDEQDRSVGRRDSGPCGGELPSRQARDAYLAERRDELAAGAVAEGASESDAAILADACVEAARAILTELLAQRAGAPKGRA
jgi:hypothetical protein